MTTVLVREASLTRRALAAALDLGLSASFAGFLVRLLPGLSREPWPPRYWNLLDYGVDVALHHPRLWIGPLVVFLGAMVVWETVWTGLLGATPVARGMGMQVRTLSGRRPGPLRAPWRSLTWVALSVPGAIGPATGLLGRRRRMLHDILSGCLVVRLPVPARVPESGGTEGTGSGESLADPDGRTR